MKEKLVSIIMPIFNGEKYLEDSIKSCLNQTHTNFELIIVNDCSTDNSLNIASQFQKKDKRIKIINNNVNLKLPASLNIGHNAAKGEFISWTSDDNIYMPNAIEELFKKIEEKQVDLVYSDIFKIDEKGNKIKPVYFKNFEHILFGNFIGSCFLYKKEVYIKNKGYNENLFLVEDYDFWLRASLNSEFYYLKKVLYNYRSHDESLTKSISINKDKNKLYKTNVRVMYSNFVKIIMKQDHDVIINFLTMVLTHQKIDFSWLKENYKIISKFKVYLSNYKNYKNLIALDKVFLHQMIHVFITNSDRNFNALRSVFFITNFYNILDLKTIKILIKHSIFKK